LVEILGRGFRAALFDRKAYNQILFERSATADAVLLVAGVTGVVFLAFAVRSGFRVDFVTGLLEVMIGGLAQWLFLALAVWFAATRLFKGGGDPQTIMRVHGYAHLPLLLTALGGPLRIVGVIWFLAALVVATSVGSNLEIRLALPAVLVGYAILFLVGLVFRAPFLAVQGFA
jgi:hypothetical protein